MKVGDLVVCNCEADMWYKGRVGLVVAFDYFGVRFTDFLRPGSAVFVKYGTTGIARLCVEGLEVIKT